MDFEIKPCKECKYFQRKDSNNSGVSSRFNGYCRRYPRVPTQNAMYITEVNDTDWCGEFIPSH